MKVQFLCIKEFVDEINKKIKKRNWKLLGSKEIIIRVQGVRRTTKASEAPVAFCIFEIRISARINDELWYIIEDYGSCIIYDREAMEKKVAQVEKLENALIKKLAEKTNCRIEKGIYEE